MATLDEVLADLGYLEDSVQFVIDGNMRTISVPSIGVIAGVVGDKNINRINFQMPRYYNGFDMSTFETRINYETSQGNKSYYSVTDVTVKDDNIMFTWLIDSDVTSVNGNVNFVVKMLKTENGVITQSFSTTIASIRVIDGLDASDQATPEETTDMLNKAKADIDAYVKEAVPADYAALAEEVENISNNLRQNYQNLDHNVDWLIDVNLDDYKTAGSYKIRSTDEAKTVQNIPEEIAGRLTVMVTSQANRTLQTYVTNSSTPRVYTRFFNGTVWKEWDKFASGKAVDNLSKNCVNAANVMITADNYTNYFTDYNDIPVNTVYDIATNVPLLNSPPGNTLVDRDGETTGYIGGVVVTFCGKSDKSRSVLQMFTTRSTTIEQTFLCFRMAYPVDGVLQWSPWQKMSNCTNLTASNIAIRKEISTRFFSDFNDAPINSIYQIDLDCDEGTLANHPNPGRSCVLVTLGFSPTSRHGMVQLCFGMLSNSEHGMWYRYGYKNAADDYRWTNWNKVGGDSNVAVDTSVYMINKGRLTDGTDLNTIEENAIYLLSGGGGYSNVPSDGGNGFVTIKTADSVTMQVYEKFSGKRWTRYKTASSEWSEWAET